MPPWHFSVDEGEQKKKEGRIKRKEKRAAKKRENGIRGAASTREKWRARINLRLRKRKRSKRTLSSGTLRSSEAGKKASSFPLIPRLLRALFLMDCVRLLIHLSRSFLGLLLILFSRPQPLPHRERRNDKTKKETKRRGRICFVVSSPQ